jgi:Holliday junction resolvase-like predicted endonuclease
MPTNYKELIRQKLSHKSVKSGGLHVSAIAKHIINDSTNLFTEAEDFEAVKTRVNTILLADVSKKSGNEYSKVKNSKTGKFKRGYYKLAGSVKETKLPVTPIDSMKSPEQPAPISEEPINLFTGKAGECAVLSELLFRGYNANLMMVDDGVDIVASKNNIYYFLQVKTSQLKENGKVIVNIKRERFQTFVNAQIRYVIVARCKISDIETNLYFVFNNQNVEQFAFDKFIHMNEANISIKIRLDKENNNRPILYHEGREKDITFFRNRFEL